MPRFKILEKFQILENAQNCQKWFFTILENAQHFGKWIFKILEKFQNFGKCPKFWKMNFQIYAKIPKVWKMPKLPAEASACGAVGLPRRRRQNSEESIRRGAGPPRYRPFEGRSVGFRITRRRL
jgi:hypothetical protein